MAKHEMDAYLPRSERLTDRKHELRRLLTGLPTSRLRYADHIEQHGTALFQRVCKREHHKEPVAGWHCCELACAEVEQ